MTDDASKRSARTPSFSGEGATPNAHDGSGAIEPSGPSDSGHAPYLSGQTAPSSLGGARRQPLSTTGRSSRKLRTKPAGASTRSLSALAILIAGALIAAQALFIPAKAQVAQVLMANAWEHQLSTGDPARPWPWADFTPAAKLSFPTQKKTVLALTDAAGESLAFGPTLMAASVKPGEPGVAVFAAHRDTHFSFLDQLKPGDPVKVELPSGVRTFRVSHSEVVRWDASGIHPRDGGGPRIALVTCWPLDAKFHGPLRYIVWAELIG